MALHTYAHCRFSGLHGYENDTILKEAYNREEEAKEVPAVESTLLRELPPIDYAHVETASDICLKRTWYQMKMAKDGKFDLDTGRDNAIFFSTCSRAIWIFCAALPESQSG